MTRAVTTRAFPGVPEGATITFEPKGKLTRDGRAHRVLTINGIPLTFEAWVIGRTLVPA